MINMIKLNFIPLTCEWIHKSSDPEPKIAVSETQTSKIFVFDAHHSSQPIHTIETLHSKPVIIMKVRYDKQIEML